MGNEFVTYPLALRLKAIGFDEPCMAVYFGNGENELFTFNPAIAKENTERMVELGHIPCPTFSQSFRWFREKYGLYHQINSYYNGGKITRIMVFIHDVYEDTCHDELSNIPYLTYEEAELACLIKLIEIVEQK